MVHSLSRWLMPAALFAAALPTPAQTVTPSTVQAAAATASGVTRPDPLDAGADVPRVVFQSMLTQYQRHSEQPVGSWKDANETVNRLGGWRVYAREAREAQPPAAPAASGASTPQARQTGSTPSTNPGGHAGDKMK